MVGFSKKIVCSYLVGLGRDLTSPKAERDVKCMYQVDLYMICSSAAQQLWYLAVWQPGKGGRLLCWVVSGLSRPSAWKD